MVLTWSTVTARDASLKKMNDRVGRKVGGSSTVGRLLVRWVILTEQGEGPRSLFYFLVFPIMMS